MKKIMEFFEGVPATIIGGVFLLLSLFLPMFGAEISFVLDPAWISVIIGDLFAAGEIAFIMAIGEIFEDKTTGKAKKGLKKLIGLAPQQGRRIVGGKEEMIPAEEIREGDLLHISLTVPEKFLFGMTEFNNRYNKAPR